MVFSIKTLEESSQRSLPSMNSSEDYDISLFENALSIIFEEEKAFNAMICEYIGEGFSFDLNRNGISIRYGLNIGELFEKILQLFIDAIENLASNFKIFLSKFLNSGSRLSVYKSKLANFRGSVHYDKLYYNYRNLNMDTSYTSYGIELEKEYRDLMNDLTAVRGARSLTDISSIVSDMREDSEYREEDMDELRGKVLGLHQSVTKEEFADEIFKYFRYDTIPIDPDVSKHEKNIDGNRVHEAYVSYFNSHNQEAIIRRDKKKLQSEAEKQKRMIRGTKLNDFISPGLELNSEINMMFKSVISNKCHRVKEICSIYTQLFNGKLMALKDYNMMNRNILLAAINEIIREES